LPNSTRNAQGLPSDRIPFVFCRFDNMFPIPRSNGFLIGPWVVSKISRLGECALTLSREFG
jgi:hypothetical protein